MEYFLLVIGAVITFTSSIILKKYNNYSESKNLIIKLVGLVIAIVGMILVIYK